ncbi:hypothetical protein ACSFA0_25145 [Variovorax sp. LT1P1]|uniref:hypothetical protein n=1 Tax=Variovorax sp. LT1P1 TaxID=3443730 RepID=UPI003F45649A
MKISAAATLTAVLFCAAACNVKQEPAPKPYEVLVQSDKFDDSKKSTCRISFSAGEHTFFITPSAETTEVVLLLPAGAQAVMRDAQSKRLQSCMRFARTSDDCTATKSLEYAPTKFKLRVDKGSIIESRTGYSSSAVLVSSKAEPTFFKEMTEGAMLHYQGAAFYGYDGDRTLEDAIEGEVAIPAFGSLVKSARDECKAYL